MSQFTIYTKQISDDYAEFTTNDTSRLQSFQNFAYFHSQATPEKKIEKIFEEYFIEHSDIKLKLPHYEEELSASSSNMEISLTPTRTTRQTRSPEGIQIWPKSHNVSCNNSLKSAMYFFPHCFVPYNLYFYNPASALRGAIVYITSQVFDISEIEELKTMIANTEIRLFAPFSTFYDLTCELWSSGEIKYTDRFLGRNFMENLLMSRIEDINLNSSNNDQEDRYGPAFYEFAKNNGLKLNFTKEKKQCS